MADYTKVTEEAFNVLHATLEDILQFEGDAADFGPVNPLATASLGYTGDGGDFGAIQDPAGLWRSEAEPHYNPLHYRLVEEASTAAVANPNREAMRRTSEVAFPLDDSAQSRAFTRDPEELTATAGAMRDAIRRTGEDLTAQDGLAKQMVRLIGATIDGDDGRSRQLARTIGEVYSLNDDDVINIAAIAAATLSSADGRTRAFNRRTAETSDAWVGMTGRAVARQPEETLTGDDDGTRDLLRHTAEEDLTVSGDMHTRNAHRLTSETILGGDEWRDRQHIRIRQVVIQPEDDSKFTGLFNRTEDMFSTPSESKDVLRRTDDEGLTEADALVRDTSHRQGSNLTGWDYITHRDIHRLPVEDLTISAVTSRDLSRELEEGFTHVDSSQRATNHQTEEDMDAAYESNPRGFVRRTGEVAPLSDGDLRRLVTEKMETMSESDSRLLDVLRRTPLEDFSTADARARQHVRPEPEELTAVASESKDVLRRTANEDLTLADALLKKSTLNFTETLTGAEEEGNPRHHIRPRSVTQSIHDDDRFDMIHSRLNSLDPEDATVKSPLRRTDGETLTESSEHQRSTQRRTGENTTFTADSHARESMRLLAEDLILADGVQRSAVRLREEVETLGDAIARAAVRLLSANLSGADNTVRDLVRKSGEALDTVDGDRRAYVITPLLALTSADTLARVMARRVQDAITGSDSTLRNMVRLTSESALSGDEAVRGLMRILSESGTSEDAMLRDLSRRVEEGLDSTAIYSSHVLRRTAADLSHVDDDQKRLILETLEAVASGDAHLRGLDRMTMDSLFTVEETILRNLTVLPGEVIGVSDGDFRHLASERSETVSPVDDFGRELNRREEEAIDHWSEDFRNIIRRVVADLTSADTTRSSVLRVVNSEEFAFLADEMHRMVNRRMGENTSAVDGDSRNTVYEREESLLPGDHASKQPLRRTDSETLAPSDVFSHDILRIIGDTISHMDDDAREEVRVAMETLFHEDSGQYTGGHLDRECVIKDIRLLAHLSASWAGKPYAGIAANLVIALKRIINEST